MIQGTLFFDQRFLGRYAGAIMSDPATALIELVANSWDAFATQVKIRWPDRSRGRVFSIEDNGLGMTRNEFEQRWRTLDYDRLTAQGRKVSPPAERADLKPRHVYGRNGRGRHAAFLFSSPYEVRTWKDGHEAIFRVSQSVGNPLEIEVVSERTGVKGHGTEVRGTVPEVVGMTAEKAREVLGGRFLTDPDFTVQVDGERVTFDDLPKGFTRQINVPISNLGTAKVLVIDGQRSDRTARQHGVAWHVNNRLVGECRWSGSDFERILDGRTSEAKRYTFIVFADFLEDAVRPDWSDFEPSNEDWKTTRAAVQDAIRDALIDAGNSQRAEAKASVRERLSPRVSRLPPLGRERWNVFVDQVVDTCPNIRGAELDQLASILAKLEEATSRYGILSKLHELPAGAIDTLHAILGDWTVNLAKEALDEIGTRLKLIKELDHKLKDENADEVGELQPLFEKALWIFGPEFETIEFTSNRGMTEVIRKLFANAEGASFNRPDFVVLPDGSVGLYSRPQYDGSHEPTGTAAVVIVELKRPGVSIGIEQKNQAWKYVKELMQRGHIGPSTKVTCFVLGSLIASFEQSATTMDNTTIVPLLYSVFVQRAEKRMMNLYRRLQEAPFLKDSGFDAKSFTSETPQKQGTLAGV